MWQKNTGKFVNMDYCVGSYALEPESTGKEFAVAEIIDAYKWQEFENSPVRPLSRQSEHVKHWYTCGTLVVNGTS